MIIRNDNKGTIHIPGNSGPLEIAPGEVRELTLAEVTEFASQLPKYKLTFLEAINDVPEELDGEGEPNEGNEEEAGGGSSEDKEDLSEVVAPEEPEGESVSEEAVEEPAEEAPKKGRGSRRNKKEDGDS